MASDWRVLTVLSSLVLRVTAYIFLRWIPGHWAPPVIFASLVTYIFSFLKTFKDDPILEAVALERDIAVTNADGDVIAKESDLVLFDDNDASNTEINAVVADGRAARAVIESTPVVETDVLIFGTRRSHVIRGIISGLPTPNSLLWNAINILTHVGLVLMTADLVYRAPLLHQSHQLAFVKVGYVSEGAASILIREPNVSKLPLTVSVKDLGPVNSNTNKDKPWKLVQTVRSLGRETDFTKPIVIPGLRHSQRYAFRLSSGFHGVFETAPQVGNFQPGTEKFTFLSSSCIKPHFPYNPLEHPLSIHGFRYLADSLAILKPSFMLFLGDWIYVDVPRRFGIDEESHRREYRQVHASPDWERVSNLSWIHVIDDHEIANDWDGNTTEPFPAAIQSFDLYHGSVNPVPPVDPRGATWRTFQQGPASFFLLDTRRYRKASSLPDGPGKTMLGDLQLRALLRWLETPEPSGVHWKVVVSSVPFTRNWYVNAQDTWSGYLHERRIILEKMWDLGAGPSGVGVVVLSGDRHEFAATSFPPPQGERWPVSATVHEFSCSPLSMFYLPFRTYWEAQEQTSAEGQEEDVCIKYIPDGNSKFGAIEIEREVGSEQSRLRYRLFVDGRETWSYGIMSPPKGRGHRGKDAVWA